MKPAPKQNAVVAASAVAVAAVAVEIGMDAPRAADAATAGKSVPKGYCPVGNIYAPSARHACWA
jgi:hypothetical protein